MLITGNTHAYACNINSTACGYFINGSQDAWCNVLPDPGIKGTWNNTGNCWGASLIWKVNNVNTFINDTWYYLNAGDGNAGYNNNAHIGAAFLVDEMLGIDKYSGTSQGWNDARDATAPKYFTQWKQRVLTLAGGDTCWNPSGPFCPGSKGYGINWGYSPTQSAWCASTKLVSGYDGGRIGGPDDAALYLTSPGNCSMVWGESMPEIVFYWNGGANSFRIGSQCGNAQENTTPLPQNNTPEGTISVSCIDPNTGLQSAHITFRDLDAGTSAYVTVNGWQSGTYSSSGAGAWATDDVGLPLPPTTDAYNKQTVILHVKDVGPLAPANSWSTWNVQSAAPCANYGCTGPSTDPIRLDPYMAYSLTVGVKPSVGQLPPNPTIDVQSIITPGGANYWSHGQIAAANNNGVEQAVFSGVPKTSGTGMFTVNWSLYTNGTLLKQCSGQFPVVNLPYLNVYGGDVMTGAAPMTGAACSVNSQAGAYSWNQYGAGGYAGAGSQYAVQALAQIEEFASSMSPATTSPPTSLAFANSGLAAGTFNPSGQGLFGGFFGDSSGAWACTADYTKGLGSPVNSNVTISGHGVGTGTQEVHYVVGHDVYITGNVTYDGSGGWTTPADIPVMKVVVVGGNIYIDSSVTELDGVYVAEPTAAGAKGQIVDCATSAGGVWKPVDPTVNGFYGACNQKLTIYGAFVAKQVLFGRTNGTLGQAAAGDSLSANHDAEVFDYTPEIWLPRSATAPSDTYDAITALPPVL